MALSMEIGDLPQFDSDSPWGTHRPSPAVARRLALCHALSPKVPGLYRVLLLLRHGLKHGLRQPLDVTIWGLKLRLMPRGNMSETKLLYAPQYFDREERELMAARLAPGGSFVDVGMNAGVYSLWAHVCMQGRGRILAVEPDPEMQRRVRFNLATNAIDGVTVCPVALSDHEGTADLHVNRAQRGENTLVAEAASGAAPDRGLLRVRTTTLLQLLQDNGLERVDVLKIDIEGHEPPVLRHFMAHAPDRLLPTALITEFKPETAALIESLLGARGYRRCLATRLNWVFERAR